MPQKLQCSISRPFTRSGSALPKPVIAVGILVLLAAGGVWAWNSLWKSAGAQRVEVVSTPDPALSQNVKSDSITPPVRDEAKLEEVLKAAADRAQVSDWKAAETILNAAAQSYAGTRRVHQSYAECLLQMGKRPEAYEQYEKAIASTDSTAEPSAELLTIAGTVANSAGKPQRAIELYKQATIKHPQHGEAFVLLGQVQLKHATLDEAKASLLQAGRLITDRGVIWGTLAEIALRENKLQIAEQYVTKARQIEPSMLDWRLIEARLRNRQNLPKKSVEILGGLSESELLQRRTAKLLSESLSMLGEKREAMELLCRASEANPTDGELALDAAAACERGGDTGAALRMAERAARSADEKVKAAGAALVMRLKAGKP